MQSIAEGQSMLSPIRQGKITLSRNNRDEILISVTDEVSDTTFLDVSLDPHTLGMVLTGMAYQPCTFLLQAEHVGKQRETKHQRVFYTPVYGKGEQEAKAAALAPHEVDGWTGHSASLGNHHYGNPADGYCVCFVRFVDQPLAQAKATTGGDHG